MLASPYRKGTPSCSGCGRAVDPAEALLSLLGHLVCDFCFPSQPRPEARVLASISTEAFEAPARRRARALSRKAARVAAKVVSVAAPTLLAGLALSRLF